MEQLLAKFYSDQFTREAVHEFIVFQLRELAADMAFKGEDTKGIADAHDAVEKTFIKLKDLYSKEKEPNTDNEAR